MEFFSLKRKGVLRENESRSFNGICFFAEILFCDERQKDIRIVRVVFDLFRPAPYVFREISEYGSFHEDEVCALPGVCHDGVYAAERFFFQGAVGNVLIHRRQFRERRFGKI